MLIFFSRILKTGEWLRLGKFLVLLFCCWLCTLFSAWIPSQYLLVRVKHWKQQNNVWNLFKVILTIKTPKRRHWLRSGVFIVKFKQISHIFLMFPLMTLNKWMVAGNRSPINLCQYTHHYRNLWTYLQYRFYMLEAVGTTVKNGLKLD